MYEIVTKLKRTNNAYALSLVLPKTLKDKFPHVLVIHHIVFLPEKMHHAWGKNKCSTF